MEALPSNFVPEPDELYFIPLGGSEQFGVNLNLYCYKGKYLAIDCGIGFADHRFPNVDILLPDPEFLRERRKDLVGLIITHAHEDHVGAVPYLINALKCPVYASEFTANVLARKYEEAPDVVNTDINVITPGETIDIGPFKTGFINVSHSIPDTCSVVLHTDQGKVIHSGDWNLDPKPVIGKVTDSEAFKKEGKDGVLAYIGDSTNSEVEGRAGSESDVLEGLKEVFKKCKGRIVITIFASNIARIHSIAKAAQSCDRNVCLVGRSLHNMTGVARNSGYLDDIPDFVNEEEAGYLPDDKLVMIVTGSQGEFRAALARIARGDHSEIKLSRGDTVIFSSRAIPGNETEINNVKNNLSAAGVNMITPNDTKHCIHVSGHPYRDEITDMLQWTKPQIVVPVHGERTQLEAQAELARECQVKTVIVPNNGSVIKLAPGTAEIVDHVHTGLLAVEPNRIVKADHKAIIERRKLQFSGSVHVTLVVNARGDLQDDPMVSTVGILDEEDKREEKVLDDLIGEIEDIIADMQREDRMDDHALAEEVRIGVRRFVNFLFKYKPKTTVHVVRL